MFGKRFRLFEIFGFEIRIDASWFLLAVLITWSLATGYFPAVVPELSTTAYWWMGAAGALGLFASVVLHELSHSLVARRFGVEMEGITLFIFGGVAEMRDEPPSPKAEAWVAIAGPIASVLVAGAFWAVDLGGRLTGVLAEESVWASVLWGEQASAVFAYLAVINLILAVFNLLPAFPLDGGRVLRAALWAKEKSLRKASRISSRVGGAFGVGLIVLGLASALFGNVVGGIWWFVLGLFLRGAARMSYQQVLLRQALEGEPVRRFMEEDPVTVPRSISVRELVEEYVYKHHYQLFPVMDSDVADARLVGCVTTDDIQQLPRDEWENQSVSAILGDCDESNTVGPDDDAMEALSRMSRQSSSRLMVVEGDRLLGILTLKDLLAFFSSKVELDDFADDVEVPDSMAQKPGLGG